MQCADAAADVLRATRGAVTRGQSRRCAIPQQSEMLQDEAERRVVIHYSGSSTKSGVLMLTYVLASRVLSMVAFDAAHGYRQSHSSNWCTFVDTLQATSASEVPSNWRSQALQLTHPKTGSPSSGTLQFAIGLPQTATMQYPADTAYTSLSESYTFCISWVSRNLSCQRHAKACLYTTATSEESHRDCHRAQ